MAISRRFKRYDDAMKWIAANERPGGYWKLNFSGAYIVVFWKRY
jgi:hypothetical protein